VAVRAVLKPAHTDVLDALTFTTGTGLTNWVKVAFALQPGPFEPNTVYAVVEEGFTTIAEVVCRPGSHVYVVMPVAVRVACCPTQSVALLLVTLTLGEGFTETATVCWLMQPLALAPLTEYVVDAEGCTDTWLPVRIPGNQV
jgi:hypothetical protein